jgi:hypothetical protein
MSALAEIGRAVRRYQGFAAIRVDILRSESTPTNYVVYIRDFYHLATVSSVPLWLADLISTVTTLDMGEVFVFLVAATMTDDTEPALRAAFEWYSERYDCPDRGALPEGGMKMLFRFWKIWLARDALLCNGW